MIRLYGGLDSRNLFLSELPGRGADEAAPLRLHGYSRRRREHLGELLGYRRFVRISRREGFDERHLMGIGL